MDIFVDQCDKLIDLVHPLMGLVGYMHFWLWIVLDIFVDRCGKSIDILIKERKYSLTSFKVFPFYDSVLY